MIRMGSTWLIALWGITESSSSLCLYVGLGSGWYELCRSRLSWLWELELDYLSRSLAFVSDRSRWMLVHPLMTREAPAGLGVIGGSTVSFVGLGGCKAERKTYNPMLDAGLTPLLRLLRGFARILCQPRVAKPNYVAWNFPWRVSLGLCQVWGPPLIDIRSIFTVYLMMYRIRGAILIGIFLVSVISWPRTTPVTLFPHSDAGDAAFDFFKKVVAFKPLETVGNVIDVSKYSTLEGLLSTTLIVRGLWEW